MNSYDLIDKANDIAMSYVDEMDYVYAEELGLDRRCGSVWVSDDCIVARNNKRNLEYYGGFEYVDPDFVLTVGDFRFYYSEDSRVRDHIDTYKESKAEAGVDK